MQKGTIKWLNDNKRFGKIKQPESRDDLFFHISVVTDAGYDIAEGAPVEYEIGSGPKGPCATRVRILGFPEQPPPRQQEGRGQHSRGNASLPAECVFTTFYNEEGYLDQRIFYDAAEKAAETFRKAKLTTSQFRLIYHGLLCFAVPLREKRMKFAAACEKFGTFYVERVVRQVEREKLPQVFKELIDAHRELVTGDEREMLGLFRYVTNILCYFGDSDKDKR